jgi:hypothetical protein
MMIWGNRARKTDEKRIDEIVEKVVLGLKSLLGQPQVFHEAGR